MTSENESTHRRRPGSWPGPSHEWPAGKSTQAGMRQLAADALHLGAAFESARQFAAAVVAPRGIGIQTAADDGDEKFRRIRIVGARRGGTEATQVRHGAQAVGCPGP